MGSWWGDWVTCDFGVVPDAQSYTLSGVGSCRYCLPRTACPLHIPFPLSQSVTSTTAGAPLVLASLGTSGTRVSAPVTVPANPPTTTSPAAVLSSAVLKPGTASCCHLVRKVGDLETNTKSERTPLCVVFPSDPCILPAGTSPAAPLGGRKSQDPSSGPE